MKSKQQSRGYGKEWRMNVTRVHRKAANLGVMRKESRVRARRTQHGFGWSNLMEIASVLETI
jgi:hypothetical protein